MRADILARGGELGPDSGVRAGGEEPEGHRGKCGEHCLDERFAAGSVFRGRAVHAMQQLRGSDSGYRDLFIWAELFF